jgi:hypothetical protein
MILKINTTHHYNLCVFCIAMWKHFTSSLWMNVEDFIFQLLHIINLLLLVVLTPPHSCCTSFAHSSTNCVNSFVDCDHISIECTNFFANCGNNYDDCANTFEYLANIISDSIGTPNKTSIDFFIPNLSLL